VIAVSAITLLLTLGAITTPYSIVFAKKHSNGGDNNGNDQKQKDNPSNGSNPPQDQSTNSGDQSTPSDVNTLTPPPPIQTLLPVNPPSSKVDCSKTPNDPSCPPPKPVPPVDCAANPTDPSCPHPSKDCEPSYPSLCIPKGPPGNHNCIDTPEKCPPPKPVPPVDCIANPTDPSCPPPVARTTVVPPPHPDDSCLLHPEQEKCKPDQSGNCPSGFLLNGKGHCFPDKKCPKGFEKQNNDETGTCHPIEPPKDCEPSYPSLCIPKGSSDIDCPTLEKRGIHDFKVIGSDPHGFDGDNDGIGCEDGHHNSGRNGNGNGNNGDNVHVTVHKHITSNSNPTSVVTRNTKITDQLTVGQAIDGCKDLTKKSPDNALKKSCNIMMAATFNYCMTHTKLWLTDSNICSDNLYLKNVQRYIAENVNLKLFPATIYNIRP
jgi:hypothetical protein